MSHLAVWVWVGAAHDVAFVLKHLHPAVGGPQVRDLMGPLVHHLPHLLHRHQREGDIRTRMEAHHSTVRGGNETEMGSEVLYQVSHTVTGESIDRESDCMCLLCTGTCHTCTADSPCPSGLLCSEEWVLRFTCEGKEARVPSQL